MTGFGQGSAEFGAGRVVAEARAVNGRFLDVRVRMARELGDFAVMAEAEARRRLSRGRVELAFRLEGASASPVVLDKDRAKAAYRALAELSGELGATSEVPLSMLSALPDLFVPAWSPTAEALSRAVVDALGSALEDLERMREVEGKGMAEELERRLRALEALVDRVGKRAPAVLVLQAQRFRERLARVATLVAAEPGAMAEPASKLDRAVVPDPARIEQELVLLVERSDVSEELTRLRIHAERFLTYLGDGKNVEEATAKRTEPLGRRLDFLLQEMAREINTVGAKSQDFEIAHHVVELKAEIEKMRELVQNVE
jgi:uncharacterized protein (TIGR00255 family)